MRKVIRRPVIFGLIIIFIATFSMFCVSAKIRSNQFGKLNLEHHNHLTGSTILFATHWYNENPLSLGFKMYYLGKSVDSPTPDKRFVYDTYPPGTIIPIYLISVIAHTPPSPAMVMGYNLFSHFWISFLLACALFLTLRRIRFAYIGSILSAFVTSAIILFMPETMYYLQNVFFSDQAVLLPFAALIFLEAARDLVYPSKFKRTFDILQWSIIFFGVLTDWLFAFICVVLFIKRLINGQLGKTFKAFVCNTFDLAFPAFAAVAFYAAQLLTNSSDRFMKVFLERTGIDDKSGWINWFDTMVWDRYMKAGYGPWANVIIWGTFYLAAGLFLCFLAVLLIRRFRKKRDEKNEAEETMASAKNTDRSHTIENLMIISNFLMLIVFPCFMQLYAFKNHSAIHDFSIAKLSFILSTGWIILPVTLYAILRDISKLGNKTILNAVVAYAITVAVVYSASTYIHSVTPTYKAMYPPSTPEVETYGTFVRDNTGYFDVVFSPDFSVASEQHSKLCWSLKQVRQVASLADISGTMAPLPSSATVTIFIADKNNIPGWLQQFANNAFLYNQKGNMCIYKIPKPQFITR